MSKENIVYITKTYAKNKNAQLIEFQLQSDEYVCILKNHVVGVNQILQLFEKFYYAIQTFLWSTRYLFYTSALKVLYGNKNLCHAEGKESFTGLGLLRDYTERLGLLAYFILL